ncbi:MAG: sterol desaturase family protein [bacterium]|nr:sterol desaturase family protein [bacterium]
MLEPFADMIAALRTMPLLEAVGWSFAGNIAMFIGALLLGNVLVRVYQQKAVSAPPEPITRLEIAYATICVILNAFVAVAGIVLWRAGIITVYFDLGWRVLLDVVVLIAAMDFAMYVFHRVAHIRWLYPLIHRTHHRFENPRPLTLFVLNPAETLGFGALLIVVVTLYPSTWLGILLYLAFNLLFGLVGHLGVEPLPAAWLRIPLVKAISTSTFHAEHHDDRFHNFGFYTVIWDRLFGTISPDYERDFLRANQPMERPG